MNTVVCFYCNTPGEKGGFKRFINDGIHYECGTNECDRLKRKKRQDEMELAIKKREEEKHKREMKFKELWGDYVYKHKKDFIRAERQYRDASCRMVDPYSLKIFKFSNFSEECVEVKETPTAFDMKNVRKRRKELAERGETFATPIDSSSESECSETEEEEEKEEEDSDNKYLPSSPVPAQNAKFVGSLNVDVGCFQQMYSRLKALGSSRVNDEMFCVSKIQYGSRSQLLKLPEIYMFSNPNDNKNYVYDDPTNSWIQTDTVDTSFEYNDLTNNTNKFVYGYFVIHRSSVLNKNVATEIIRGTYNDNNHTEITAYNE